MPTRRCQAGCGHPWSAYRCSVRTNNDVEGSHNRLNRKTRRGHLDIYQLASLLFSEAQYVDVQARLVAHRRRACAAIRRKRTRACRADSPRTGHSTSRGSCRRRPCFENVAACMDRWTSFTAQTFCVLNCSQKSTGPD